MTRPLLILNVVGLTPEMIGPLTPHISEVARTGFMRPMGTVLPAVTCTAQATMLTGTMPREHGIVGNGWYFRDLAEVMFWKQSNHLIQGEKLYEAARHHDFHYSTAKMFWWYNMYAPVEFSMTPRPSYPADGRKVFDSYSQPADLRDVLQSKLGVFPLHRFWGPTADIRSSRWIADASIEVIRQHHPELCLVYLPHLDYNLQRIGPADARIMDDIRAVDVETGKLIDVARSENMEIIILSEYAITAVSKPIHINRVLRSHGLLRVRLEPLGWETLDCGASRAFAVADHQVAHVYVRRSEDVANVREILGKTPGIADIYDRGQQSSIGLDHERSGDLVAVAAPGAWFTYYFWDDDDLAPDYARTIDIHRKPGYDPVELFVDPEIHWPKVWIARRLLQKFLGFRYYMDIIGLDAGLVKGSHGRLPTPGREASEGPVFICSNRSIECDTIPMTAVKDLALRLQFGT